MKATLSRWECFYTFIWIIQMPLHIVAVLVAGFEWLDILIFAAPTIISAMFFGSAWTYIENNRRYRMNDAFEFTDLKNKEDIF